MCQRSVFLTKECKNEIRHYYGKEYEINQLKYCRIGQRKILRNRAVIMIQLFMPIM